MASRSTFRDPAGDVAWQRQLRDRYADEPPPPVPHLDLKRAIVRPVSRRMAEQIILKYEWLGTMAPTSMHFGLFFGAYCAGVVCLGYYATAGAATHRQYGLGAGELVTLARGACTHWAPKGANSRLVAWACRLIAHGRQARLVVAYADVDAGEVGTVYQAANWVYIGPSASPSEWVAPNGRAYNQCYPAHLSKTRGGTFGIWSRRLKDGGWREQASNPKHRYVYVLDRADRALVERIDAMRQPYPKRAKQSSDAPAVQAGEGGAAPTGTLQAVVV